MDKMRPSTSCVKTQDKGFEAAGECVSLLINFIV
jgi:hypothetical protein